MKEFIDKCISSGKVVSGYELSQEVILEIEDILNRFNDKTARTKIRKLLYGR